MFADNASFSIISLLVVEQLLNVSSRRPRVACLDLIIKKGCCRHVFLFFCTFSLQSLPATPTTTGYYSHISSNILRAMQPCVDARGLQALLLPSEGPLPEWPRVQAAIGTISEAYAGYVGVCGVPIIVHLASLH